MTENRFLTTAEAAKRLDVKPETIYAYVSRGLLTSVRSGARRGSLFAQDDVDRLVPDEGDELVDERALGIKHPDAVERPAQMPVRSVQ